MDDLILYASEATPPPEPATGIVVTNLNDSGPGSLRQAISDLDPGDSITFDVTGTISLKTQLDIGKDVKISGPGVDQITISGNDSVRVFNIKSGDVLIEKVTVANGIAQGGNGSDGSTAGGGGGGGGGGGFGGGVLNQGNLTIKDAVFSENQAVGGKGGRGNVHHGSYNGTGGNGGTSNSPLLGSGGAPGVGGGHGAAGGDAVSGGGGGGGSKSSKGGKGGSGAFGGGGGGSGAKTGGGSGDGGGTAGYGAGDGANGCCSAGAGGGGGAGLGAAIFNNGGTVTVISSKVANNSAVAGPGAGGGYVGAAADGLGIGGGIFNKDGTVTVTDTAFCDNIADTDPDISGQGVTIEQPKSCAPAPAEPEANTFVISWGYAGRSTTWNRLDLNDSGSNVVTVTPNSTVTAVVDMEYTHTSGYCPGCIVQFYVRIQDRFAECLTNGQTYGGGDVSRDFTFTAPGTPGTYYIQPAGSLQYQCLPYDDGFGGHENAGEDFRPSTLGAVVVAD